MKFNNFFQAARILKYILINPNCSIPQIRDFFGVKRSNPPSSEEKNLYKLISYLDNSGFIIKKNSAAILPRGAHYSLQGTQKGSETIKTFKKCFSDIPLNFAFQNFDLSEKDKGKIAELSTDFSRFSYKILNSLMQGLLDELPLDTRRFLRSKRPKINKLIEKYHQRIIDKISNIIDSLT